MLVLLTNNQQREYEDSSILSRLLFCALLCPMFDLLLLTSSLLGTHPIESTSLVRTAAKCFRQRTVVPSTKQPWHDELARTVAGVLVSVFCVTNQFRGYMCGVLVAVRVDRKNDLSSFSSALKCALTLSLLSSLALSMALPLPNAGHGGHLSHALQWFGGLSSGKGGVREMCPTGCGHKCNLIKELSAFPRTDSLHEKMMFGEYCEPIGSSTNEG